MLAKQSKTFIIRKIEDLMGEQVLAKNGNDFLEKELLRFYGENKDECVPSLLKLVEKVKSDGLLDWCDEYKMIYETLENDNSVWFVIDNTSSENDPRLEIVKII